MKHAGETAEFMLRTLKEDFFENEFSGRIASLTLDTYDLHKTVVGLKFFAGTVDCKQFVSRAYIKNVINKTAYKAPTERLLNIIYTLQDYNKYIKDRVQDLLRCKSKRKTEKSQ